MKPAAPCRGPSAPGAVLVAVFSVCIAGPAQAQVQLTIEVEAAVVGAREPADAAGVADTAGAIGDPWWDAAAEAVPTTPAAAVAVPQDAQAQARQRAQARLSDVRRSRGTQILKRELSLVRAACPTLEPAARAAILGVGRQAVAGQAAGRTPLVDGVETAIEAALLQQAGAGPAAAYRAEREARARRRQEAALAVLVDTIDRDALLDATGRTALAEALAAHWRPEWVLVASLPLRQRAGGMRLPDGVAEVAATVLDEDTVTAWRQRAQEAAR